MNSILKAKLSIVTSKPQTTRKKILGIYSDDNSQMIFLDTPGLIEPKYLLQKKMVESIKSAFKETDIIIAVVDTYKKSLENFDKTIIPLLQSARDSQFKFLVINKIDLITKEELLQIIDSVSSKFQFDEIIPVSALMGFNVKELTETIKKYLPAHEPYYPADILSQEPERFFISEIIREKIFELYRDEIPYSAEVIIAEYRERTDSKDYINAEIIVERDSQKKIIIGKNGAALKKVGQQSRKDIEEFLGKQVFLELRVKIREDWRNNPRLMKDFGY
jgi:GTP-binding protein Era